MDFGLQTFKDTKGPSNKTEIARLILLSLLLSPVIAVYLSTLSVQKIWQRFYSYPKMKAVRDEIILDRQKIQRVFEEENVELAHLLDKWGNESETLLRQSLERQLGETVAR